VGKYLLAIHQRTDNQNIQGAQKTKLPPKINESIKKWETELNRTFSRSPNGRKHMKKYSPSLVMKEMQIKTTIRFNIISLRIARIKNTTNNKCW
jgi:hypothetical protein